MGKLKILIPVDPEIPVPPTHYGGVERLVDGLITEYTIQGHDVYLLAHEESTTRYAKQIFTWKGKNSRGNWDTIRNSLKLLTTIRKVKPDIVHSFARLLYLYPSALLSNVPFVMTYGRKISPKSTSLANIIMGKRLQFTSAAKHMLNHLKYFRGKFTSIYNFVDINYFLPNNLKKKEYLMFLGRVEDIKGVREVIEVAIRTNEKLIIAGNIQPGHEDWFEQFIKPHLSNPLIQYVGSVGDEQKRHYLQGAKALLFPIKWEEPFGIVMIEAMACGVPVIAFRRGSVSEVIKEGINGFIVENVEQMVGKVKYLASISRDKVRDDCISNYSREIIGNQYLGLYNNFIETHKN